MLAERGHEEGLVALEYLMQVDGLQELLVGGRFLGWGSLQQPDQPDQPEEA